MTRYHFEFAINVNTNAYVVIEADNEEIADALAESEMRLRSCNTVHIEIPHPDDICSYELTDVKELPNA